MDIETSLKRNWMFAFGGLTSLLVMIPIIGWLLVPVVALLALAITGNSLFNANTLTGLLREADQAMYRAKARARDAEEISGDDLLEKAI